MGEYTNQLETIQYEIFPEEEDYTEKLLSVVQSFRGFGEALDAFIVEKGF